MQSYQEKRDAEIAAFKAILPWISPTEPHPTEQYKEQPIKGVTELKNGYTFHVGVRNGGAHKTFAHMPVYGDCKLDKVNDVDWDLFHVNFIGNVKGRTYYWGSFVLGLGAFNVMVPVEWTRDLLPHEREAWSKKVLGMYGSHSGELSYTLGSGVSPA